MDFIKTHGNSDRKLLMLIGSTRPKSLTRVVGKWMTQGILQKGFSVIEIDPTALPATPFGHPLDEAVQKSLQDAASSTEGVVCLTPEYHGSYSASLKAQIENLGYPSVLKNKPIALVGVAAGVIGAVKSLEHLRGVFGHLGCHVMPQTASLAEIYKIIDSDGNILDQKKLDTIGLAIDPLFQFLDQYSQNK